MFYPIGVQNFETMIERKYVYVDKTDLVHSLAQQHVCFLSRPRRFGKSMLISTLENYFLGKKDLFQGLKIENLEKAWEQHPVFRIDFAAGDYSRPETLETILDNLFCKWEKQYHIVNGYTVPEVRFLNILEAATKQTGHRAVVLIDEYDKPMLDALGTEQEKINRSVLKGLYGVFKTADEYLRFVLLTGVTKFSQISVFSGFNQPKDISMDGRYDGICGITESELQLYFAEPMKELASEMNCTVEEIRQILKKQYDGYHFSEKMLDIYNPFSIMNTFDRRKIDDYWYRSGTPTYLAKLLEGRHVNLQRLTGQLYTADYFIDYHADVEEPLAMLYQSGYLTIKGYDEKYKEYRLDFPNDEVKNGFMTLTANSYFGELESRPDHWVKNLDRMFRQNDLEGIRIAFTSFLASIPYEANKDERAKDFETHFSYTFYIINRLLGCYTTLIEKQNSKGRADVIIETETAVSIFEFKLDGTAEEALRQIDEQQYALPYLNDSRLIQKIGVNISSKSRAVEEWLVSHCS